MKKISVIIPAYKVEKYIADTIQSVLNQTHQNFEIIIVDDGSPDRSFEICQQYTDSRVKIIRQENQGVGVARNTGISCAQGEYIAFLDGDDIWLPEKLEKHVAHLEQSPRVGLSFSCSAFIDENGKPLGIYQMPKLKNITLPHLLCRNPISNASTPVIRREVFEAIKFQDNFDGCKKDAYFDNDINLGGSADIECWFRIAITTPWLIEGIPDVLTLYRLNSDGLSANILKQLESWEKVMSKTRSYAPELINRWEALSKAYQLRYLARRAVRLRDGSTAVTLINSALSAHAYILIQEPRRTLLTLAASYILWCFPKDLFYLIENLALNITGKTQTRKINENQ
jgi:glycosyltransferase involved in cell wall biosynthesis